MASVGQVPLREVWAMLDVCAPGHSHHETTHNFCIRYNGLTYPSLPKKHPSIDRRHIKKMARHLGILECAKEQLSLQSDAAAMKAYDA